MANSKEPIRLRQRKMPSGLISLYLDIYLHGKRSYEYLRLYLIPEKTRADKEKNRTTLALAEDIRAKRMVELRNGEFGFKSTCDGNVLFYQYFERMFSERTEMSSSNRTIYRSCLKHMKLYDGNAKLTFRDITPAWVEGFKNYLSREAQCSTYKRPFSKNTRALYLSKLKVCLKQAVKDRIIPQDPSFGIENLKTEAGQRMYLTVEEIQRLVATECRYPVIKRAFLFSCLTGLRFSDIEKLTWGEVQKQGEFTRLIFRQKKTSGQEYLDISPQAVEFMGERGESDGRVFDGLISSTNVNIYVRSWVKKAGIDKHITFHCARHTFAVMMLDLGADIYTVSKLLGHRELSTTQIYAKVLDKNKQAAVAMIPPIIEGAVK